MLEFSSTVLSAPSQIPVPSDKMTHVKMSEPLQKSPKDTLEVFWGNHKDTAKTVVAD